MQKILVVDDSVDLAEFLTVLLQMRHFEVATAASKREVTEQLKNFKPDLVLLDVVLSNSDGRELCKEIKSHSCHKKIPIILLSASPDLLKNYEACQANDVMEKPFDIDEIIDRINKHLAVAKMHPGGKPS